MDSTMSKRRTTTTTTTTTITSSRRIITRSIHKKQQMLLNQKVASSPIKIVEDSTNSKSYDHEHGCSTPKSDRYKIPEIVTCPPAPKKPRVSPSINCLIQKRRPITFFAHPDLDKFFMFSSRDNIIKV
ncbi:hypothetical protein KSS87_001043 [Heliosperma pusillum]|nr:hypothetical protein KSS87_009380 [Heliosperma pusillum]KAH9619104.1 hypothetical protein KSS87_021700 [Heliosperma pusillum]KAH9619147.1 hypothetical protein KSS87_001043 [Heliosperma pusillum]